MKNKYKGTVIACYFGSVTQSIVINLAPLFFIIFRTAYGFSYGFLATLILLTFFIQIIVDLLSVSFVAKLGFRKCAVLSQAFSMTGLILLGVTVPLFQSAKAAVILSVLFYSIGGGLIEVILSPIIDSLPSESKDSSMSLLHSFYSWGQVLVIILTTLLLSLFTHAFWFIIPLMWSLIPAVNIILFSKVPIIEPKAHSPIKVTKELFKSKLFIMFFVLMICSGAAEQVIAQWASLFCENALGVSKVTGDLLGPCMFAAFMGIGRTFYGVKGSKLDLTKALVICSLISIVCYILTFAFRSAFVSLAGCALCGLGVSLMWPGMLSLSSSRFENGSAAMFSLLALGGDLGCSFGPYLSGLVSDGVNASNTALSFAESISMTGDELSLKCGIAAGLIFPVLMLIGTLIITRNKKALKK